jgi:hypothetical protein
MNLREVALDFTADRCGCKGAEQISGFTRRPTDSGSTRTKLARWLAVSMAILSVLWWPSLDTERVAASGTDQNARASHPNRDLVTALPAMGPHPSLGDQANVFGRFVGTWDVEYNMFTEDGKATRFYGEVIAGWVMDGHAVQDLFISYPKEKGKERAIGTTIRYFEPKTGMWRVIFILPQFDYVRRLTGGPVGDDRIVLRGQDPDGTELRWSFNDIRSDTFVWRGEKSRDGGKTWWMEEEHHFKRRAATGDARRDMIKALESAGQNPSLGDQAKIFGQFAGTWDVDYGEYSMEDGKAVHYPGQMIGGWVLDGRAFQDLFVADPKAPAEERTMGTTLRYFDDASGKWRVVYVEPPSDTVVELTGGQEGDRIVLYSAGRQGSKLRWSFNEIKEDSFTWRGERSRDGGKTWQLIEEHHMKRRPSGSP